MDHDSAIHFTAHAGNRRHLPFLMRRYLDATPWDVSTAVQILLEITDPLGVVREPIQALDTAPGADWANGVVIVTIDVGDVTGMIGTWQVALTLFIGDETVTYDSGVIDVIERPGYVLA